MRCENIILSNRDSEQVLCTQNNASNRYWSSTVTKCGEAEFCKSMVVQQQELLAFLGSHFSEAQVGCTNHEQEPLAIHLTYPKLSYLMVCEECVRISTDHRSLLFIFHPCSIEPSYGRLFVLKVRRRPLCLSTFSDTIKLLEKDLNILQICLPDDFSHIVEVSHQSAAFKR